MRGDDCAGEATDLAPVAPLAAYDASRLKRRPAWRAFRNQGATVGKS